MNDKSCIFCVFARQGSHLLCGNKEAPPERQHYTYHIYSCDLFETDANLTEDEKRERGYQFRENGIYKPKPENYEILPK